MKPLIFNPQWWRAFGGHLWRHFIEDRCFEAAGSLSYKSLIALVPLLAVVIGIASSIGVFESWIHEVESFVFEHFVPAKGGEIQGYVNDFVGRAAGLTASGSIFLILIAILLMSTIERSFNRIWRVRRPRPWLNRVVMYWAVLTLGPLLIGASLVLTSYFTLASAYAPEAIRHAFEGLVSKTAPFFVAWIGFLLVFLMVPNRRVFVRHAALGGFISALLFEIAKRTFVVYLADSDTYEHLYGALAIMPIFLLWIYILWVVVLLGASFTAALTTFNLGQVRWHWSRRQEWILMLRLLSHLWHHQIREHRLTIQALNRLEPAATDHQIQHILSQLEMHQIIAFDEHDHAVLIADLEEKTLMDLYQCDDWVLPVAYEDQTPRQDELDDRLRMNLERLRTQMAPLEESVKSWIT